MPKRRCSTPFCPDEEELVIGGTWNGKSWDGGVWSCKTCTEKEKKDDGERTNNYAKPLVIEPEKEERADEDTQPYFAFTTSSSAPGTIFQDPKTCPHDQVYVVADSHGVNTFCYDCGKRM